MKIRKDDTVRVMAGKSKGKTGRVLRVDLKNERVYVEGANIVKRHQRPRTIRDSSRMGGPTIQPGGIIDKAAPVPVANVMLVCPVCKRPTRIGSKEKQVKGETVRVRVCRREGCGEEIDR